MGRGFLGTNASFYADVNLVVQILMGAALLLGFYLARQKRFRAHRYCQTSVVVLNLVLIAGLMVPSFRKQASPRDLYHAVALVHGLLGAVAELLGIYIVLVAGTNVLPPALKFDDYKPWMRTTLALWWTVIAIGVGTYAVWYRPHAHAAAATPAGKATVTVVEFDFVPRTLTVSAGTTVTWTGLAGKHSVEADDGSFKATEADTNAGVFTHRFDAPGTFLYSCEYHGEKGGKGMSGVIEVRP